VTCSKFVVSNQDTQVYFTNKTDCHDITEILLSDSGVIFK
jgi:hypothetical protein